MFFIKCLFNYCYYWFLHIIIQMIIRWSDLQISRLFMNLNSYETNKKKNSNVMAEIERMRKFYYLLNVLFV